MENSYTKNSNVLVKHGDSYYEAKVSILITFWFIDCRVGYWWRIKRKHILCSLYGLVIQMGWMGYLRIDRPSWCNKKRIRKWELYSLFKKGNQFWERHKEYYYSKEDICGICITLLFNDHHIASERRPTDSMFASW